MISGYKECMKNRFLIVSALIFFAPLFLSTGCTPTERGAASPQTAAGPGLRQLSQRVSPRDFSLPVASAGVEGETLTLSELRGNVVVLNFWATWCPSCRSEMPSLESLHSHHKEDGLTVVAVNMRESREHVHAFMDDNGFSFLTVLDTDGRVGSLYGVQAIPTSFVISREGYIVARLVGRTNWDSPGIRADLQRLLERAD